MDEVEVKDYYDEGHVESQKDNKDIESNKKVEKINDFKTALREMKDISEKIQEVTKFIKKRELIHS